MTDQQTYTDVGGNAELIIFANGIEGLALRSQVNLDDRLPVILCIPAPRLLAMIDRLDPDAMRAYLRETSETQLDGIDAVAAGISRQIIAEREVPEADSPEDVDERPGRDDPTERAQIDRAWAMEHAAAVLGRLVAATGAESGELPVTGYASWILTGSTETLDR